MKGKKSPGGGGTLYDRLLVPRLSDFALNHTLELDSAVEYLRTTYREYNRQKLGPFRNQVARAIEQVIQRGVKKPELRLQVRRSHMHYYWAAAATAVNPPLPNASCALLQQAIENRHLERKSREVASTAAIEGSNSSDESSGGSSDAGGSSSSGGIQLEGDLAADADSAQHAAQPAGGRAMNRSVLNLYGGGAKSGGAGGEEVPTASEGGSDSRPAFAPPHVIAAAAARAAKEEAARKQQQQPQQQHEQPQAGGEAEPAARMDADEPAAAAAAHVAERSAPATTSGKGAMGPTPVARAAARSGGSKRGGATPVERGGSGKRARTAGGGRVSAGSLVAPPRPVTYADLGGIEDVLVDIRELIEYPLKHPEVYGWLGVEPPRGVLLHGPPGCGKTALANAIANECGVPFLRVSAPEVVSGMSGESEAKIRQLFQEAAACAPCIVFIGAARRRARRGGGSWGLCTRCWLASPGDPSTFCFGADTRRCLPAQMRLTPLLPSARMHSARWSAASLRRCSPASTTCPLSTPAPPRAAPTGKARAPPPPPSAPAAAPSTRCWRAGMWWSSAPPTALTHWTRRCGARGALTARFRWASQARRRGARSCRQAAGQGGRGRRGLRVFAWASSLAREQALQHRGLGVWCATACSHSHERGRCCRGACGWLVTLTLVPWPSARPASWVLTCRWVLAGCKGSAPGTHGRGVDRQP